MIETFRKISAASRWASTISAALALSACAVIPKAPVEQVAPPPPPAPVLPTDQARHRIALLVPLSGPNGAAGQAIANAATMAILDTNATSLRITTYDTSTGAADAAARAVADGAKLILGPLVGEDAVAVAATARSAHVPTISFASDVGVAGNNVFVMGTVPNQVITREVQYARHMGATRFAALVPVGSYGERVSSAVLASVRASGGTLIGMESHDRTPAALAKAVRRLKGRGTFDAVLLADNAQIAAQAAPLLRAGNPGLRILGTQLWSGEAAVARTPALGGAVFAALSDQRFRHFSDSYKARYNTAPYRIATLGYDAVLLTLRIGREWRDGAPFPAQRLYDKGGFLGLDGVFRFNGDAVIERALELRQVKGGMVSVISAAPARFDD